MLLWRYDAEMGTANSLHAYESLVFSSIYPQGKVHDDHRLEMGLKNSHPLGKRNRGHIHQLESEDLLRRST